MKTFFFTSMLIALPFFTACSQSGKEHVINTQTVRSLDLKRYLGKWYEIARFDHPFERNMVGVTAEYSMRPDGKIRVLNSGYKGDLNGKFKTAEGKARQPDPKEPGKLILQAEESPAGKARVGDTVNRTTGEATDLLKGGSITRKHSRSTSDK